MASDPPVEEGRLAPAWQNQVAGRALRQARSSVEGGGAKQSAFVARLERELGISLSVGAYSNYENGRRTIPAAVLIEAARIAGRSLDDLLSEVGQPEVVEWVGALGVSQRVGDLEREVALVNDQLRGPLQSAVESQGELLARMVTALEKAGIRLDEPTADRDTSPETRRGAL
ncbi:MAG: helix-turn-helix transcriptional regulator [Actinobacteria bacterium]|nr:helix-turn-helix transcriptional regulator [Actinomycetota bacterium]